MPIKRRYFEANPERRWVRRLAFDRNIFDHNLICVPLETEHCLEAGNINNNKCIIFAKANKNPSKRKYSDWDWMVFWSISENNSSSTERFYQDFSSVVFRDAQLICKPYYWVCASEEQTLQCKKRIPFTRKKLMVKEKNLFSPQPFCKPLHGSSFMTKKITNSTSASICSGPPFL